MFHMTLFSLSCIAMYADAEIFALVAKYRCSGIDRRGSRDTGHPVSFVDETNLTGNIAETSQSTSREQKQCGVQPQPKQIRELNSNINAHGKHDSGS